MPSLENDFESKQNLRLRVLNECEPGFEPKPALWEEVISLFRLADYKHVGCYFPMEREINVNGLWRLFAQADINLYFPYFKEDDPASLRFYGPVQSASFTSPLKYKQLLAKTTALVQEYQPLKQDLDILFVPCVGLNQANYRLGYGSGFYDRFATKLGKSTQKIALLRGFQMGLNFKEHAHDMQIDQAICIDEYQKYR